MKRDPEVHQDVRSELEVLDAGHRSVEITAHHGVVYLTGLVESYAHKWAIDRAVTRIVGVKDLRDHLHVRRPDAAPDDGPIARAANHGLRWDARVPNGIRAEVTDGVLCLRGVVERFWQRVAAEEAVRNLRGVRDVVNEIAVLRLAPPPHLTLLVEATIRRRLGPGSEIISIAGKQGVVRLSGVVPTLATLGEIELAIWSIPGITWIDNQLLVE